MEKGTKREEGLEVDCGAEGEGFPFYYVAGADRKGAVKAEWDDSALLQILTDTDIGDNRVEVS